MFVTLCEDILMGDAAKRNQSIFPSAHHDQHHRNLPFCPYLEFYWYSRLVPL